jgi:hypothetical protein
MYGSDRGQIRDVFFRAWRRYREGLPVEGAERLIVAAALRHPEYHALLVQPADYQDRDYLPEMGTTNPFLHLSMHIAIEEQISIDQPRGIRAHYERIRSQLGDEHEAQHRMMDCLGEMIWQAQRAGTAPDEQQYLACLAACP